MNTTKPWWGAFDIGLGCSMFEMVKEAEGERDGGREGGRERISEYDGRIIMFF